MKKDINNSITEDSKELEVGFPKKTDKSKLFRKIIKLLGIIFAALIGLIAVLFLVVLLLVFNFSKKLGISNPIEVVRLIVFTQATNVGFEEDRVNVIILGKGGLGHEAPELTDTIIFVSIPLRVKDFAFNSQESGESIVVLPIPRDLWVESMRAKINSAYYWGNKKSSGGGIDFSKAIVEEVIGKKIHYGVVVDFSAFKSVIDALGGIDVVVENSFVDNKYPIVGRENDLCGGDKTYKCRYETVKFEKGTQHMDGDLALKFVRSRFSEGDEGTDFARSARQEKVILAIKDRLSPNFLLNNPYAAIRLINVVSSSVETDINEKSLGILARGVFENYKNIYSESFPEELILNPPISKRYDFQYVFSPKSGNWKEVQNWVNRLF